MSSSTNTYVAVVDDDESLCRSFSRLLRAAHFQAITYPSAEALLADAKHPKFDCLVLDIQLPGISGVDLAQRLAAVKDRTPVIFITAYDDPATLAQAEAIGCCGCFSKTASGAAILDAIRRVVGQSTEDDPPHQAKRTADQDATR